jgi:hypothetical protein
MKKRTVPVLISVALVTMVTGSAHAAVTEPQPPVQTTPSPSAVPAQPGKPAWLTPEKEAVLVEVRKILKEAWDVAEHIEMPSPLFTQKVTIKTLSEVKQKLQWGIVDAQLQAGDFSNAAQSYYNGDVVLAQIRYGHLQEAVQNAVDGRFARTAEVLTILKVLSDAGEVAGAMQVAEAQVRRTSRGGAELKQYEAELMAYVARRQAEAGKPEASETLARAIDAARSNEKSPYRNSPYFQHGAWTAIGCAQAAMGDRNGGEASMLRAIKAAANLPQEEYVGQKGWIVSLIGRAAAESGLQSVSQEAFRSALRLAQHVAKSDARAKVMAKVAVSQSQGGDRIGGQRTLEEAITFARNLPDHEQRRRALGTIVEEQFEGGDPEGAAATLERRRRWAETMSDEKEREAEIKSIRWWDSKLLPPQMALEQAFAIQGDDEKQAEALASATYILVNRQELVVTPEILQRMSQTATTLLAKPLPSDPQKADRYLSSIARVQAVADGADQALQTLSRVNDSLHEGRRYVGLASLLTQKGDLVGAKRVIILLKEDVLPFDGTTAVFREVANVQAQSGDVAEALEWARQQKNPYAKAETILGVSLGIMEREGIHSRRRPRPASVAIDQGARDTLELGCAAL